jgi:hypothetical protein
MTKRYKNEFGRTISALQWNKVGDHPLVFAADSSQSKIGIMHLLGGAVVMVKSGSYLVETPGLQHPTVWSRTAFEKLHKEIKDV